MPKRRTCEHARRRTVPGAKRGRPAVEWCRDCGAARFGFLGDGARWVYPGKRARTVPAREPERRQLRIVGVDDVPCPVCEFVAPGDVCGLCGGSGIVPRSSATEGNAT